MANGPPPKVFVKSAVAIHNFLFRISGGRMGRTTSRLIDERACLLGWSLYGAQRWQPVAISGKSNGRRIAQTSQIHCDALPPVAKRASW